MKRTVVMTLVKETKGALRYEGLGDDSPSSSTYLIGTLYLRKSSMTGPNWPTRIYVSVEDTQGAVDSLAHKLETGEVTTKDLEEER